MAADLKLASFSDREVLHLLHDLADHEGWVDLDHLVQRVNLSRNGMSEEEHRKHVRRCLGIRLGWIRRLTMTVERDKGGKGRWRLTVSGEEVVKAKLTRDFEAKLEGLGDFMALPALEAMTRRYARADVKAANLMRRQWQYGIHPNRERF
jgi:hypothetical protein